MFIFTGIVTNLTFLGKCFHVRLGQLMPRVHTQNQDFQSIQGAPQISIAEASQELQHSLIPPFDPRGAQAAHIILHGALQGQDNLPFHQRFEVEEMTSAQERGDDVKSGIVGGGANQTDISLLHIGKEEILLSFVEPMQLVDKQYGAVGWAAGEHRSTVAGVPPR